VRRFSRTASAFTAETDCLLEQRRFELMVPPPNASVPRSGEVGFDRIKTFGQRQGSREARDVFHFAPLKRAEEAELEPSSGFDVFHFAPLKRAEEAELEPSSGFDVFYFAPLKRAEEAKLEPSSGFDVFILPP
jgi:hypothetical protein